MGCGASTAATPATTEAKPVVAASKEATAAGKDLAPVFKQFDTSGDGYLQLDELKRAFRAIGLQKRKGEDFELDEKTFKAFDTNGDGKISLEEFNANLHPKTRAKLEEKLNAGFVFDQAKWDASAKRHAARGEGGVNLSKLFAQFDTDGDGFLDIRELQRAFRAIGMEKRKGEKFELDVETFKSFDTNGDEVSPEVETLSIQRRARRSRRSSTTAGRLTRPYGPRRPSATRTTRHSTRPWPTARRQSRRITSRRRPSRRRPSRSRSQWPSRSRLRRPRSRFPSRSRPPSRRRRQRPRPSRRRCMCTVYRVCANIRYRVCGKSRRAYFVSSHGHRIG